MTEKKKVLVVCLAGARSLLRPEKKSSSRLSGGCAIIIMTGKKKIQSSVWRVRDRYYDRKKISSSRLSGGCAIAITTGKKVLVVCLAGAQLLLGPEKKSSIHLSGWCAITTISTMGPIYAKSSDFYAKLNVSNLNVTSLY